MSLLERTIESIDTVLNTEIPKLETIKAFCMNPYIEWGQQQGLSALQDEIRELDCEQADAERFGLPTQTILTHRQLAIDALIQLSGVRY